MLEAEMDVPWDNQRTKRVSWLLITKESVISPKTVKSQYGELELNIPRDRYGGFEPKIIPKYQRDISGIKKK